MKKIYFRFITALMLMIMLGVPAFSVPAYAVSAYAATAEYADVFSINAYAATAEENVRPSLVVDEANLLFEDDKAELVSLLEKISKRHSCEVAVVTVDDLDGKTALEYADEFFVSNGYGYGSEHDGVMLLVSMEDRDWAVYTKGFGITAFTDAGLDYMADEFLPMLSDGDYAEAFMAYAEQCDSFLEEAREGKPYDVGSMPKENVSPLWILLDLLVGFVIALILGIAEKKKLKTVHFNPIAGDYEVPGSFVLSKNRDVLVNSFVTTRRIPKNNSGGSGKGGSTVHRSSSGGSYGGRSGKF